MKTKRSKYPTPETGWLTKSLKRIDARLAVIVRKQAHDRAKIQHQESL